MFWGTGTLLTMSGWHFRVFLWHLPLLGLRKLSLSSMFFPTLHPYPHSTKLGEIKRPLLDLFWTLDSLWIVHKSESPILVNGVRFMVWFIYLFICQIIEEELVELRSNWHIHKVCDFRATDMGWLSLTIELSSPSCLGILNGTTL